MADAPNAVRDDDPEASSVELEVVPAQAQPELPPEPQSSDAVSPVTPPGHEETRDARALDGNWTLEDAFELLVAARPRCYRLALSLMGNRSDADDVVSEAIYQVALRIKRNPAARIENMEKYLTTATKNGVRQTWRARARVHGLNNVLQNELLTNVDRWRGHQDLSSEARMIVEYLGELSLGQFRSVVLVDYYGFEQTEAAAILGVKPTTVRTHLDRAYQKLATSLNGSEGQA